MSCRWNDSKGFTLIEVLVALVIVSSVGLVLLQTSQTSARNSVHLIDKTLATWVAEDRATTIRIAQRLGQAVTLGDAWVTQSGQRFRSRAQVQSTTDRLQKVSISVYYPADATQPLYQLDMYLPQQVGAL